MLCSLSSYGSLDIPSHEVQADKLPVHVVPIPFAHERILARLDAEVFARRLVLPRADRVLNASSSELLRVCVIVIALPACAECAYGVEGQGGLDREDIRVEAVEDEGVGDLENNVHSACRAPNGVFLAGSVPLLGLGATTSNLLRVLVNEASSADSFQSSNFAGPFSGSLQQSCHQTLSCMANESVCKINRISDQDQAKRLLLKNVNPPPPRVYRSSNTAILPQRTACESGSTLSEITWGPPANQRRVQRRIREP